MCAILAAQDVIGNELARVNSALPCIWYSNRLSPLIFPLLTTPSHSTPLAFDLVNAQLSLVDPVDFGGCMPPILLHFSILILR